MKNKNPIFAIALGTLVVAFVGCSDLKTDLPSPVTPGVQVHRPDWVDTSSTNFHGKVIRAANGEVQECLKCHGLNYQGGTSGVSCVACHQTNGASLHGRGWTDPSSPNFHGNAIRSANWDMRPCQSCHGALYDGGKVGVSCRECHTNGAGPENCATCHGSANPAPPKDLNGNTSTTAHGVGAHQRHLLGGGSSATYTLVCSECHHVPPSVYSAGHVDSPLPADVLFQGGLSGADPSDVASPAYDSQTFKCNNVFCHGNWNLEKSSSDYPFAYTDSVMRGSNYAPLWTGGSVEVACGTCHGLPPAGHAAADTTGATCGTCHTNPSGQAIVNTSGQIVDKLNHLNGKINVFATQKNF